MKKNNTHIITAIVFSEYPARNNKYPELIRIRIGGIESIFKSTESIL
jgi:hypothetical protein